MVSTYFATLALMALSGGLMDWHRRTLRAAGGTTDREQRFAHWQYLRRMSASATIGVLGIALAFYPVLPRRPWPLTLYVAFLLIGCVWMMGMALADAWATRAHFQRQRREELAAQLKGLVEARRRGQTAERQQEANLTRSTDAE